MLLQRCLRVSQTDSLMLTRLNNISFKIIVICRDVILTIFPKTVNGVSQLKEEGKTSLCKSTFYNLRASGVFEGINIFPQKV